MSICPFEASLVALPTPLRQGEVDFTGLQRLIDRHASGATSAILVTTAIGEAATLTDAERRAVVHASVGFARGRLPVIAGIGSPSTRATVALARYAAACGADGLHVVTPFYNGPSRPGLVAHYGAVADATDLPIIICNAASRTGVDLDPALASELAGRHANIVGIEEQTSSVERLRALMGIEMLSVFAGDDAVLTEYMGDGAAGAINVTGNLFPDAVAEVVRQSRPTGHAARASELWEHLVPLARLLSQTTGVVYLKTALAEEGLTSDEVHLPLVPLTAAQRERLSAALVLAKADR